MEYFIEEACVWIRTSFLFWLGVEVGYILVLSSLVCTGAGVSCGVECVLLASSWGGVGEVSVLSFLVMVVAEFSFVVVFLVFLVWVGAFGFSVSFLTSDVSSLIESKMAFSLLSNKSMLVSSIVVGIFFPVLWLNIR